MFHVIEEKEFMDMANIPIKYIVISSDYCLYDDNLLDCNGVIAVFEDKRYSIESNKVGEDRFDFRYRECPRVDKESMLRRIVPSKEEPIRFIRKENGEGEYSVLRFQIGERPLLITAEEGGLTVGFSHWDMNDEWIEYEDDILLNDK